MNENVLPPYQYITVEGAIGAGKTTLCEALQKKYGCGLILETFADNPFLPLFYENPDKYALPVELFFLMERRRQLVEYWSKSKKLSTFTLSDYFFLKSRIFAGKNLPSEEYKLFLEIYNMIETTTPKPDLVVYLYRSVENLKRNIQKRGRSFELNISEDYLEEIQRIYLTVLKEEKTIPILWLDVDQAEFLDQPIIFEGIIHLISQKFLPGVHSFRL